MSSVVETAAEHAAADLSSSACALSFPAHHAAEKKLPEEEEKKPSEKEEKNSEQVTSYTSETTQVPVDTDEPTSEGVNAVIKKDQTKEHLLAVEEEDDGTMKLQEKKVKKRKRIELQQIKQEKMVSDAKKIQLKVDAPLPHLPCQEHLLAVAEEDDGSEKVKLQKKKVKKRNRSELQQNKEVQVDAGVPMRWCASYSTLLLPHRARPPRYKGSIVLDPELNRVALLDTNETTIDYRYLKEEESIYPGLVLEFACHKAEIGKQNHEAKEDIPKKKRNKRRKNQHPLSSPQAKLVGSSIGMFARMAALRKRMSPQVQGNVTVHFPSPNLPHVGADFTGHQPRKLKSRIWKDFVPIYEHGKVVEGQCKHCNEVCPASKSSGTNHVHRHIKKCETRRSMHEMVSKIRASSSSPQALALDSWSFSQKESRRDLANMIVHHGLPFSVVEYSGFRKFVKGLNPMFKMVSRTTIREDCIESYKEQRSVLRETLKNCGVRVSLTADMWTSNQRLGYMCITCHFIDKTWKMQKRILRFCMMETPHTGFQMYNTMLNSLQYWNIEDKICSITLDNASVNGSMMDYLKENLTKKHMLTCGGKLFHIRCAAHVLNLVVQDGLLVMKGSIDQIRESVKYVRSSEPREKLFADIVRRLGITCQKVPSLDVAHRWNSTYLMIDSSLPYMEAFEDLAKEDRQFKYAPSAYDWEMAEAIHSLLKLFFEATNVVSGSSYPTANRYFHEIWSVRQLLQKQASNKNPIIASMVSKMQKKFNKYWKESYLANCIPVILDPRYKRGFIEFRLGQAFGHEAGEHLQKVDMIMKSLFEDYSSEMVDHVATNPSEEEVQHGVAEFDDSLADWQAHLFVQKKQAPNELERYLNEELFPQQKEFDILGWWGMHGPKYPVISCIARDVLAIQASTVASESSFSAGGRILTDHRSRLTSKMVEALVCLQDWLKATDPKTMNKDAEEEESLVFYQLKECHEETAAEQVKDGTSED